MCIVQLQIDIESVVDFGAGVGSWLKAARDLGATKLIGIEKFYDLNIDGINVIKKDVISKDINIKADLSICVEVAEHIKPNESESLVDNLVSASDVIIFGAANIYQPGDAHINCREVEYWEQLFKNKEYCLIDCFRQKFWKKPNINKAYVQNTYLFIKKASANIELFNHKPLLNIVHPELINPHYLNESRKKHILFKNID